MIPGTDGEPFSLCPSDAPYRTRPAVASHHGCEVPSTALVSIEIRSLSTLRLILISRAGLREFAHRTVGRGSIASPCFTFQIKVFAPEPIDDPNKDPSGEDKAERHSMADVPSQAESKDHDRTRNEHYGSSQPYSNSMHCVSDLVSRHNAPPPSGATGSQEIV